MSMFDWQNDKLDELGADLCSTMYEAHDEALLVELAEWINACAVLEVRQALHFLTERVSVEP